MTEHTPETHRMRDAVANSDWMDAGRVTPETIQEGYATFDRWLADVKAEAWDEACQAFAWCRDNGPIEDALPHVAEHNPYQKGESNE